MVIPSHRLRELLSGLLHDHLRMVPLRDQGGKLLEEIPIAHAYGLAVQGSVEGVHTQTGRLKYIRQIPASLAEEQRKAAAQDDPASHSSGKSTAFAVPNIGVFREALGHPDPQAGQPHSLADAPTTSYCYSFALLRGNRLNQHASFRGARVTVPPVLSPIIAS